MRPLLLIFFLPVFSFAQRDSIPFHFHTEKRTSLVIGYNFNFGKSDREDTLRTKFHFLEVGIWQTKFFFARHWGGWGYSCSTEIGLNTPRFTLGPKVGAFMAIGPLVVGNDFCWYFNADEQSLRWAPYFGLGTNRFKLTINPHLPITNRAFASSRGGHLNFSLAVIHFARKRTEGIPH